VVQTSYTYEPFGQTTVTGQGNGNPLQYTGRENDGTGLYYYRARYYSPSRQRFILEDRIGFAGGDTNLYGYVYNNPLTWLDPLGSKIDWGTYVFTNPYIIYNLQRLNQAIIDQGLADAKFTLRITGGDRFVDSKGKARSLGDFTYVDDSAPNSGHLIQNGGRAADLAQGGVSNKVFDRALQETAFDPKLTRRQEYIKHPHTHIELPNKAPFNPAPASIPDMYGRKDRP
jgi:RHS repeat-associated protein